MRRLLTFLLLLLLLTPNFLAAAERPNLLIITVDDMSCDSVGVYGCKLADTTPNMDRLASQSLRFNHAHVQVGNCMPSRNVMFSGRYPHNNRVEGFYQVKDARYPVLATIMQSAGYFTAIRHKVSHSTPYSPFKWDKILDKTDDGKKAHVKDPASYGVSTTQGIRAAANVDKPFCVVINIGDPHKPFHAQARNGDTIPDPHSPTKVFSPKEVPVPGFLFDDPVVRKELAHYYSSVRRADDAVGQILAALDSSGKANETIVMFLSDHGMALPFAKTQLYHHSTRTPLMVRWPGVTKAGVVDNYMVSAVDFLPTLLDVTGIKHPKGFDGRSFEPLLHGKSQDNRDMVFKEYNENAGGSRDPMRAVQTRKYLYLFNAWSNGERIMATATTGTPTYRRMAQLANVDKVIKARHHLYQHRVVEELYDIEKDPDCLVNLIKDSDHQQPLGDLRTALLGWMEKTGDHMLDVYKQRDTADAREAYVLAKEKEADERRKKKRKAQRNTKNKGKNTKNKAGKNKQS
ncbi:MAG: heparan N-sulfatase [Planctomycetaceae bacterium]|nr:heparan N-sulfatase [Planctomycetaceae bacterium]